MVCCVIITGKFRGKEIDESQKMEGGKKGPIKMHKFGKTENGTAFGRAVTNLIRNGPILRALSGVGSFPGNFNSNFTIFMV